jgi:hypothetical protein
MFIIIWLVGVLLLGAAIIVVLVIQGFEIRPPAFRAPALRPPGNPLPFADDSFPPPVRDYLRTSLRGEAWLPENAAIWGRASFLKKKRWVSLRFKTLYLPGRAYFRRWQSVWYGLPIWRGEEYLRGGQGYTRLYGRAQSGELVDRKNTISLWVEAVWFPALFVMDKQIHWEEVSVLTANLIVPYKDGEESLTAFFDPQTCLLSRFSTLLVRPGFAKPQPWRVEFSEWQRINGIMIPFQAVFRWENDPQPYARWTIDGAALNLAAFPWLPESRLGK